MEADHLSNAGYKAYYSGLLQQSIVMYAKCLKLQMRYTMSEESVAVTLVNASDSYGELKKYDEVQ